MAIKIGCFALINPFSTLDKQLDQIKELGIKYADLTDNTDGACLGNEYGFTAVASGFRDPTETDGASWYKLRVAFYWTSTDAFDNAIQRSIRHDTEGIARWRDFKNGGRSMRCVKD